MDFKDYTEFAEKAHTAYFATVDGNQPRVRPIGLWFADERGFYFFTETVKSFYKQLNANKKVEICFHSDDKVMRASGEIEFINDIELRAQLLKDMPFLKGLGVEKPDDPLMAVFRIARGEAFFWTMASNMKEAEIERIKFGNT